MAVKGATIPYDKVEELFAKIPVKELESTKSFLAGDHWQGGAGWVGWQPEIKSTSYINDCIFIQKTFTSQNVIKGMVWRLRGAVLGKEPDWEVTTIEDAKPLEVNTQGKRIKDEKYVEIDKALTVWWTEKRVHEALKNFATNYASYGKAAIRIYVPKGYVETDGDGQISLAVQSGASLSDVLSKIYISTPDFKNVAEALDEDFGEQYVCLQMKKDDISDEIVYEVHYLDEKKQAHVRQLTQANSTGNANNGTKADISLDLGGALLTYIVGEYDRAMISPPVKQQQRQVNHAKTMEGYAIANINFPETTFINADIPTETTTNEYGKTVETAKSFKRGMGVFLKLIGLPMDRADGSQAITTPEVHYRDGADPAKFATVAENNTRSMHQEAGMIYILLSQSPYPSGDARIESMTDYLILLVDYKTLVDTAGVWLLSTVLRLAYHFTGQTEESSKFRVVFSSKLTLGRMSVQDKTLMLAEVNARLRSQRNYMITAEVTDDPSTELSIIATEPLPVAMQMQKDSLEASKQKDAATSASAGR